MKSKEMYKDKACLSDTKYFFDVLRQKEERPHFGGRLEIYHDIETFTSLSIYCFMKLTIHRNLTNIRISTRISSIVSLRKKDIDRCMIVCKLCDSNTVCRDFHAEMECTNPNFIALRIFLMKR